MPLGAARIALLAKTQVTAVAEVIRKQIGVSAFGNAQVDTAQSKFNQSSAVFDGTGDYLSATNSNFTFDQSEITIEFWVRPTDAASGSNQFLLTNRTGSLVSGIWYIRLNTDGTLGWAHNSPSNIVSGTTALSDATWHHVAVVKYDGDFDIYLDGSLETSVSAATTGDDDLYIGARGDNTLNFAGHIDEIRISDTARYTSTFTPSTTPFVNDANTLLLLHMDGTDGSTYFPDDNGTRHKVGIRAGGNAQVDTAQSKFGGASYLSDGTGDYLQHYNLDSFDFGTGDFTYECWLRADVTGILNYIYDGRPSNGAAGYTLAWQVRNDNKVKVYTNATYILNSTSTISANTWYHVAVVRSGDNMYLYLDGSLEDTATGLSTASFSSQTGIIGAAYTLGASWDGYFDEFRISDTARYTASFTAPTEPFQNDDNTVLLLHMDGTDASTDFEDDNGKGRSQVSVTAYNGAEVDTAESKFGGGSYIGDRVSQTYLDLNDTVVPATGEFTIESWVNFDLVDSNSQIVSQYNNSESGRMVFGLLNSNFRLFTGSNLLIGTTTVSSGTWYHVAVCRDSSNEFRLYVNGVEEDSATSSVTISTVASTLIGRFRSGTSRYLDGHIEEVRISSVARYSANFTPQTEPFQNDADTLLLLHMDGTDGSTTFRDDNGTY